MISFVIDTLKSNQKLINLNTKKVQCSTFDVDVCHLYIRTMYEIKGCIE